MNITMVRNKKKNTKKNITEKLSNTSEEDIKLKNTNKGLNLQILNEFNQSSSISILDITSRINLPLIETGNNLSVDSDDEETLEFHIRPRFVYMCNLCLVCMNVCNSGIKCDKCQMVFYCSIAHRDNNEKQHRNLCRALTDVCHGMNGFSLAKSLPPDLYRTFRIKTIDVIEKLMGKRLDLWEREIILYPRICRSCKKTDNDLNYCHECGVDFFCTEHQSNHLKWCKDFQVFRKILCMQHKYGYINPDVPVVFYDQPHVLPENFDFLMYSMFENSANYRQIDCYTYASLSYISTAPLTTLFAIQKSIHDWKVREDLKIHIIGAEFQFECVSLHVWEKLFMHFLPKLYKISIEFIGPELYLPCAPPELLAKVKLCRKCKSSKRKIDIQFNPQILYHKSVNKFKPDIICLFNPGLYRETGFDGTDTWPCTIKKFCNTKVPVVITSYTEFEIPRDIERVKSICNVEVLLEPQQNPFAAVKPDRNFVSDDVVPLMYKNYCISIVKGL